MWKKWGIWWYRRESRNKSMFNIIIWKSSKFFYKVAIGAYFLFFHTFAAWRSRLTRQRQHTVTLLEPSIAWPSTAFRKKCTAIKSYSRDSGRILYLLLQCWPAQSSRQKSVHAHSFSFEGHEPWSEVPTGGTMGHFHLPELVARPLLPCVVKRVRPIPQRQTFEVESQKSQECDRPKTTVELKSASQIVKQPQAWVGMQRLLQQSYPVCWHPPWAQQSPFHFSSTLATSGAVRMYKQFLQTKNSSSISNQVFPRSVYCVVVVRWRILWHLLLPVASCCIQVARRRTKESFCTWLSLLLPCCLSTGR